MPVTLATPMLTRSSPTHARRSRFISPPSTSGGRMNHREMANRVEANEETSARAVSAYAGGYAGA